METQANASTSRFNVGFFFLCLGVLITIITSVVSFLNLVFETFNKRFPDVLNAVYEYGYSSYQYEGIRVALATLIIIFPIFLVLSYFWRKFIMRGLGQLDELFKKWVVYIVLFLSALVVAGDLITLVRYFISGEITYRFILKALTALIVAGLVGFYYVLVLKGKTENKPGINKTFAVIGIVLVVAAIGYSFAIIGSPLKQRALRLDDRRINDLQSIQYQVINYWQQKEKLPAEISELANPLTGYSLPRDPEFEKGKAYEYNVLDKKNLKFELCAEFALPIPQGWRENSYNNYRYAYPVAYEGAAVDSSYPFPGGGVNESWEHEAGRTCFERTIDPEIYPPYPKPLR